jgi:hypothetical protein
LSSIDAAAVSSIKLEGRWQLDCYWTWVGVW